MSASSPRSRPQQRRSGPRLRLPCHARVAGIAFGGQITERMILFTAVNGVFAYLVLALLLPFLHIEYQADLRTAVLHPVYAFAGALAGGIPREPRAALTRALDRKNEDRQFILTVAAVVLTIGMAHSFQVSVALALVTLGMLARNLDSRHALLPVRLGRGAELFFVIFFVLTGASLEFHAFGTAAAGIVAAYVVMRFLGKHSGVLAFGKLSGCLPAQQDCSQSRSRPCRALPSDGTRHRFALPVDWAGARVGGARRGRGARADRSARHSVRACARLAGAPDA